MSPLTDEIPRIVYTGGGKADNSHAVASRTKLSQNVSKAADSAKEKLTSLFNKRSTPATASTVNLCTSCESCRMVCKWAWFKLSSPVVELLICGLSHNSNVVSSLNMCRKFKIFNLTNAMMRNIIYLKEKALLISFIILIPSLTLKLAFKVPFQRQLLWNMYRLQISVRTRIFAHPRWEWYGNRSHNESNS